MGHEGAGGGEAHLHRLRRQGDRRPALREERARRAQARPDSGGRQRHPSLRRHDGRGCAAFRDRAPWHHGPHRPERRRQVHVAQVAVRPRAHPLRQAHAQRAGHHESACRQTRLAGCRLRATDGERVPEPHDRREHAYGRISGAEAVQRALRLRLLDLPQARRPQEPAGRPALRRRAADGGDGARADDAAECAAARRAKRGPLADDAGRDLHSRASGEQGRRLRGHRRAERAALPADLRPRRHCSRCRDAARRAARPADRRPARRRAATAW